MPRVPEITRSQILKEVVGLLFTASNDSQGCPSSILSSCAILSSHCYSSLMIRLIDWLFNRSHACVLKIRFEENCVLQLVKMCVAHIYAKHAILCVNLVHVS